MVPPRRGEPVPVAWRHARLPAQAVRACCNISSSTGRLVTHDQLLGAIGRMHACSRSPAPVFWRSGVRSAIAPRRRNSSGPSQARLSVHRHGHRGQPAASAGERFACSETPRRTQRTARRPGSMPATSPRRTPAGGLRRASRASGRPAWWMPSSMRVPRSAVWQWCAASQWKASAARSLPASRSDRSARAGQLRSVVVDVRHYAPTWLIQLPSLVRPEQHAALQRELLGASRERMVRELCEALEVLHAHGAARAHPRGSALGRQLRSTRFRRSPDAVSTRSCCCWERFVPQT